MSKALDERIPDHQFLLRLRGKPLILFILLQDQANVDRLSAALAEHWFDRGLADLKTVAEQGKAISRYEHRLRDLDFGHAVGREAPSAVRDPAFRRVVTEIYDYSLHLARSGSGPVPSAYPGSARGHCVGRRHDSPQKGQHPQPEADPGSLGSCT